MARRAKPRVTFPPVAFVADVHLASFKQFGGETAPNGLNARGRLTVETLERAVALARKRGCQALIVGGDLFHHRRPEPAIIAAANRAFAAREDWTTLEVHVLPGNHDTIDGSAIGGNTACATVEQTSEVHHGWVDLPVGEVEGAAVRLIPFNGGSKPMAQFVDEVMTNFKVKGVVRAVATHVGVVDDDTAPWLRDAQDAMHKDRLFDAMDREDVAVAFVGNYHQHREWERGGRRIVQVGVLNPTGFADAGLDDVGGIAFWDGDKVTWEQVPGPRFVKVASEQEPPAPSPGCSVYVRAEGPGYRTQAGNDCCAVFAGYEMVPAEPGPLEQADLAKPSRLVESAEEALGEWVTKAALPAGVTKVEVGDMLKDLWRRAS
jgi:hypothetical protein